MNEIDTSRAQMFYHGTKADLKPGDLIGPGFPSNYGKRKQGAYVYFSATLDAATWGAELAIGEGEGRIYIVEPTGKFEDDPNLTDKKFPGNPTKAVPSPFALDMTPIATGRPGFIATRQNTIRPMLSTALLT